VNHQAGLGQSSAIIQARLQGKWKLFWQKRKCHLWNYPL